MNKQYYCPADDFNCPYYDHIHGVCKMEGDPTVECDEFMFTNPEDWEEESEI